MNYTELLNKIGIKNQNVFCLLKQDKYPIAMLHSDMVMIEPDTNDDDSCIVSEVYDKHTKGNKIVFACDDIYNLIENNLLFYNEKISITHITWVENYKGNPITLLNSPFVEPFTCLFLALVCVICVTGFILCIDAGKSLFTGTFIVNIPVILLSCVIVCISIGYLHCHTKSIIDKVETIIDSRLSKS